ncbi:MAG: zinc ribbon domain-containing protein [Pyrinomonadaceae bacterium]
MEIARRCHVCGAAVRGNAAFCPNCGGAIDRSSAPVAETTELNEAQLGSIEGESSAPVENYAQKDGEVSSSIVSSKTEEAQLKDEDRAAAFASMEKRDGADGERRVKEETRTRRQRAVAATREKVEEKLMPRVEKVRHASNVVLDEAAYDPSLRFVLIAAALFLFFIVLLVFSHVLG